MKISAKGRYGIAAMVFLARNYDASSPITIISISEHLGISKIYLSALTPSARDQRVRCALLHRDLAD